MSFSLLRHCNAVTAVTSRRNFSSIKNFQVVKRFIYKKAPKSHYEFSSIQELCPVCCRLHPQKGTTVNAPQENSQKFLHRTNQANGLILSICASCSATVAIAQKPRLLEFVETRHQCRCTVNRSKIHVA
jgi:hypothetical protein